MIETTHELKIFCRDVPKTAVTDWLIFHGIDTFVEGSVDDLDIDHEYNLPMTPKYEEVGGDLSPVSVFKFEKEILDNLKHQLEKHFENKITCDLHTSKTQDWVDGWKKNFTPLATKKFLIVPPWDKQDFGIKKTIVIEPGMAFGTGHHATTLLCLELLEECSFSDDDSVLDVGTGTGILAIACSKLGLNKITATDIDPDALTATTYNLQLNDITGIELQNTDIPSNRKFDCVVANILAVVLKKILPLLTEATSEMGCLILSGLLEEDAAEMINEVKKCNFNLQLLEERTRDGWSALKFKKIL